AMLTVFNVIGVRPVGRAAVVLAAAALLPVAAVVVAGVLGARAVPWTPFFAEGRSFGAGLGVGLAVVMWNYLGWDTPTTVLGEARAPDRPFRPALFLALPVIVAAYVLPLAAALATGRVDASMWRTGALPDVALAVGGPGLAWAVAAGAVLSTAGLFL